MNHPDYPILRPGKSQTLYSREVLASLEKHAREHCLPLGESLCQLREGDLTAWAYVSQYLMPIR
jgi:hypothetical protein